MPPRRQCYFLPRTPHRSNSWWVIAGIMSFSITVALGMATLIYGIVFKLIPYLRSIL